VLDPRRAFAPGYLGAENNPRGSGSARRPRCWIRRCAQAIAASSNARPTKGLCNWIPRRREHPPWVGLRPTPAFLDSPLRPSPRRVERSSTHEGPSGRDASALKTIPVGRASPDARVPGFIAEPKPSPRRAMLDPRRVFAIGYLGSGNTPRGSGSARRPRSWIHRCTQALAASSDARPTKGLATGFLGSGNTPRGSGSARRPRSWIRRCTQAIAASSDARPTKGLRDGMPRRWKHPPWVGLRPTPAFLDSSLHPSPRRVERCSTHEGSLRLDASALKTIPVGRAPPDARVPGFIAAPKPSPRRTMLDPRRAFTTGCLGAGNTPRGSGSARRPRSRTSLGTQSLTAPARRTSHPPPCSFLVPCK